MGYQVNDAVLALAGALVVCKESLPDNDVIVQEKARFPRTCSRTVSTAFRFFVRSTIQRLIDQKLLYQSKYKSNAIFINFDRDWDAWNICGTFQPIILALMG